MKNISIEKLLENTYVGKYIRCRICKYSNYNIIRYDSDKYQFKNNDDIIYLKIIRVDAWLIGEDGFELEVVFDENRCILKFEYVECIELYSKIPK